MITDQFGISMAEIDENCFLVGSDMSLMLNEKLVLDIMLG